MDASLLLLLLQLIFVSFIKKLKRLLLFSAKEDYFPCCLPAFSPWSIYKIPHIGILRIYVSVDVTRQNYTLANLFFFSAYKFENKTSKDATNRFAFDSGKVNLISV